MDETDTINRQAAIDALGEKPLGWTEGEYELGLQNQWQSDVDALNGLPSAQPDSCEGCKHLGKWEPEVEYGYSSPCTLCKRRVGDHYER